MRKNDLIALRYITLSNGSPDQDNDISEIPQQKRFDQLNVCKHEDLIKPEFKESITKIPHNYGLS